MHTGQSTTVEAKMCEILDSHLSYASHSKPKPHSSSLTLSLPFPSPITLCIVGPDQAMRIAQRPSPFPSKSPGPPNSRTGAVPSTGCEEGEGHLATQHSLAPSPAAPPSPELFAAAGAAGPKQALQAECRQGSNRGSRSGRRRSRHTPQCSRSSCASPPPPAGDDADAEAAAAEEAAGRFSPLAGPSLEPGLPEAAEAVAAAEAAAAAAEAAIHTPPGGGGAAQGRRGTEPAAQAQEHSPPTAGQPLLPRGRAPPRVSWADARRAPGAAAMRPSRWLLASLQTMAPPAPPPPLLLRRTPQDLLSTARPRAVRRKSRGLEAGQKYLAPTTPRTRVEHRNPGAGRRQITHALVPSLPLAAGLPGPI